MNVRSVLHSLATGSLDADELDLEWRIPLAPVVVPAVSAIAWPCDEESPVLFIGAERAATKGDTR